MSKRIQYALSLPHLSAAPPQEAGRVILYSRAAGLYCRTSDGAEAGPLVTASPSVVSVTAAHTAASGTTILAAGTLTVTLPIAAVNAQLTIKNTGIGVVTVTRAGSALIDGVASRTLGVQYETITVVSDGANWFVI